MLGGLREGRSGRAAARGAHGAAARHATSCYAMRVPAHAAVGTSVELVRDPVGERPVRLVNAVLRRIGATPMSEWLEIVAPRRSTGPPRGSSASPQHSHPRWVVEAFADALAAGGADAASSSSCWRLTTRRRWSRSRSGPGSRRSTTCARTASSRRGGTRRTPGASRGGDPQRATPGARRGRSASRTRARSSPPSPSRGLQVDGRDERWLDLCAGPGGKAALLAGPRPAARRDPVRGRASSAPRGARGPCPARLPGPRAVVAVDGTVPAWPTRRSTGSSWTRRARAWVRCGAVRRPGGAGSRDDLEGLVPLQRALLALGARRGRDPAESSSTSPARRTGRRPARSSTPCCAGRSDVGEEDARPLLPEVSDLGGGPHVQLWPHRHGTDAMFVSVLRVRRADPDATSAGRRGGVGRSAALLSRLRSHGGPDCTEHPRRRLRQPAEGRRRRAERRLAARRRDGQPLRPQPDPGPAGGRSARPGRRASRSTAT